MSMTPENEKLPDFEEVTSPADIQEGKSKKRFFPPWTRFLAVFFVIVICITGIVKCAQSNKKAKTADLTAVAPENKTDMARVGLESSPAYSDKVETYAAQQAEEAARTGGSYVAPVTPSGARPAMSPALPDKPTMPTTPTAGPTAPRAPVQPAKKSREQKGDQAVIAYLGQLNQRLDQVSKPQTTIHNVPQPIIVKAASTTSSKDSTIPPMLIPGDILYAINRVSLDSDAPGPVMVEVVDDGLKGRPYKGARVIGAFKRLNEHLTLEFSTITMPSGVTYSITGFGIDPKTDRTAVRTSVDNHTFAKWTKLLAASFFGGWGEAVSRSGTSSYSSMYGGGYSAPKYDLSEQMTIASGKAADKASNIFQREFDVPPTVTLKSGTEMGVLIFSVGKAENGGVNEAIQAQQNAVQQREGQPVYNSRPITQQQQNRTYPY